MKTTANKKHSACAPRGTQTHYILVVVQHAKKANAQIGTFGFCRPTSQTQKTKRAYFFTHARTDQQENERKVY